MKKIAIMAAVAVFGFANVNAQEDVSVYGFGEGDIFIEGNVGFNSSNDKNTEEKASGFNISPKAGYFLTDDLALGLDLSYASSKTKVAGTTTADVDGFGAGVFARYYFLDLGKRFKTYTELGAGYASAKDKGGVFDEKFDAFGAGLDLGINYFVTEKIALTFGLKDILSFSSGKTKVGDVKGEAVTNFNFGFGDVANPFGGNAAFGILFKI
ncbi:outer membrane beta-barrel protein [Xanthomarina sp. F1114]|uniref:outer membrane beta-barrel protein n=1 Tax=Xanthomarina sp. F1114 TaxID=2996019 RepID=UPI00225E6E31|nr:outer membrane beta-barrel protein [Xanthomarina sp. F1114]MCX7547686.1 outer membrane beta-barrel protein [Xanthomarina sp. F1114]